jgi:DNA polymerase (family 10)
MPAGAFRRGHDVVDALEIVAASDQAAETIAALQSHPGVRQPANEASSGLSLRRDDVDVTVRVAEPANAGALLLWLTGSAAHLDGLQARATARGLTLRPDGLFSDHGTIRAAAGEDDLYAALGLPWIPPEIRDGAEAIDVAGRGELPPLVSRADIRGDLHMHTTWSDGRDSLDTMALACRALGYEYIAITDHSQSSAAVRNLTVDGVARQADEIARLRERCPDLAVLHGCEVDILRDGRLDFPDRILERLDIVLASLHDGADQTPAQLMARYESAMRHPLVTVITHPSNRLVPHRDGYDLDYDRLFAMASETGTVLEIDGAPAHLDLDGGLARRAIAAGATVSIDSDCHRADLLDRQLRLGLVMARRGWVEPRHVLNARPLAGVRAVVAAKRAR